MENSPDSQRSVDNPHKCPSAALRGVGALGGGESIRLAFGRYWTGLAWLGGLAIVTLMAAIAGLEG